MTKIELGQPSPSEIRKSDEYLEGQEAFLQEESITENPYVGEKFVNYQAWYWSYGWYDAMAMQVWRNSDGIA